MAVDLSTYFQQQAARHHRAVVFWHTESNSHKHRVEQLLQQQQAVFIHQVGNFRTLLGTEHTLLYNDLASRWNANALVGISGTLKGQGLLIIAVNKTTANLPSVQHWQGSFSTGQTYHCRQSQELITLLTHWPELQAHTNVVRPFVANSMQQQTLNLLNQLKGKQALLLYAPRGRGKTATLAHWLSKPHSFHRRFICAPSKLQAAPLLAEAIDAIFLPPDQLTKHVFNQQDLLLIDEAATLPIAGQNVALYFPGTLVLATTTEGYEYAGRGFIIRFAHTLKQQFPRLHIAHLEMPMRWHTGDALETANSIAFGLYPNDHVHAGVHPQAHTEVSQPVHIEHEFAPCKAFTHKQRFAIFRLLVEAHYQTSPNDIQRLLDDAEQSLFVQWHVQQERKHVLGVSWLSAEGPLSTELALAVASGKRRLPGQLLPQAYAYYAKTPTLAKIRHVRVVRITIAPAYQGAGYGSRALSAITHWAQQHGFEALGTSFGISPELLSFWHKNAWLPVRVGHKPDPASRLPSAIYAYPITDASRSLLLHLHQYLLYELKFRQRNHTLPAGVTKMMQEATSVQPHAEQLLQQHWHILGKAFAKGELNFLDYLPWLAAALHNNWDNIAGCAQVALLQQAVNHTGNLSRLAEALQLSGKKEALTCLRAICTTLHQQV